jgi:hypothetical protein
MWRWFKDVEAQLMARQGKGLWGYITPDYHHILSH